MMRRGYRLAALAAVALSGACGEGSAPLPPPTEESVVGEYTLRSVNGYLPYFIGGNAQQAAYIVSGSMDFRLDKTFTDILTTRIEYASGSPPTEQTSSSSGTYTLVGRNLALVYTSVDPIGYDTVAVTGTRMTQNEGSLLLTYRK